MKTAYVAGPIMGNMKNPTAYDIKKNVNTAEEIAAELWQMGYSVVCPHKNTEGFVGLVPREQFLEGDLELIRRGAFDVLVMMPGWNNSPGAILERQVAIEKNIDVFYWPEERCELWVFINWKQKGRD